MLKKTKIPKNAIAKILENYDLGPIAKIEPLYTSGNITFIVFADKGKFILRICPAGPRWRSKQEIAGELEFIDYLAKNKFPAPIPFPQKNNSFIAAIDNKFGYLRYYDNGAAYTKPNLKQIEQFGALIGRFHKLTEGYKTKNKRKHIWDLENTKKYFKESKTIITKSDFKDKFQFIKRTQAELSKLYFPDALPQGMIHEDLGKRHILWKNNEISRVIDFDRCYYGKLILDLGQAIRGWCFTDNWKQYSNKNFEALIKGYTSERKITPVERKYLFDAIKFAIVERGLSFAQRYIQTTQDKEDENFAQHSISENGLFGILDENEMKIEEIIKKAT